MTSLPGTGFVSFANPSYLLLLAALPLVVWFSLRSLAGLGPWRARVATGVRCLVLAALVAALAGPEWVRTVEDQSVAFVVDVSDSVPEAQQRAARDFVAEAAAGRRVGKDRVAVLSFAARRVVDQLPATELASGVAEYGGPRHQTDVAAALRLAAGPNRFAIPIELAAAGVHRFRAVIEPTDPAADVIAVSKEGRAFTVVGAATRVAIVSDTAQAAIHKARCSPCRPCGDVQSDVHRRALRHERGDSHRRKSLWGSHLAGVGLATATSVL
jgi:hypothetical protein